MKQYDAGLNGEAVAEDYLLQQGMTLLARRYRAEDGEIDLIMRDGDTVVFVEVKARPGKHKGTGLMAVTANKQRRMTHTALAFLAETNRIDCAVRFDAVEITMDGVLHVPNAFFSQF